MSGSCPGRRRQPPPTIMSGKSRHLISKIAPTPHPPLVASPRPRQNTPFMDGHSLCSGARRYRWEAADIPPLVSGVGLTGRALGSGPVSESNEYRLKIDAYTPDTLPIARLAEYMTDLAKLLGEPESVHFVKIDEGSAVLVHKVDDPAAPKIAERVVQVRDRDAPSDVMAAYERLDRRLRRDNSVGQLLSDGTEVIHFPGRDAVAAQTFGPFSQMGTLNGVVMRLGGLADVSRVAIWDRGTVYARCRGSRDLIRELAPYIYGPELRFHGRGRWTRDPGGKWNLEEFWVRSFDVLDQEPLTSVVAKLRDIPGNQWRDVDDPWRELTDIRHGDAEAD